MRNKKQIIWDMFALLRLFRTVNEFSHIDGNLKVQKLSFITELYGLNEGLAAMHFKFFRYTHGPFSKDLAKDIDRLVEAEVLTTTKRLTKKGEFVLDYLSSDAEEMPVSNAALTTIEKVATDFGKYSGLKLKDMVYKMTVPVHDFGGEEMKVRDIETFTDIFALSDFEHVQNPSRLITDSIIDDINNEINLPLGCLDVTSKDYQKTVNDALQHALSA